MEDSEKKINVDAGDKEILYSRAIKAGKRIYYLDVKKNLKDDLFVAITESKKIQPKDSSPATFEKHKIFLYKEDFGKFMEGLTDVIAYIQAHNGGSEPNEEGDEKVKPDDLYSEEGDIKLSIDF